MGSRLLNGCPQLSTRVTISPLMLINLPSTFTLGTIAGTPVINKCTVHTVRTYVYKILSTVHS